MKFSFLSDYYNMILDYSSISSFRQPSSSSLQINQNKNESINSGVPSTTGRLSNDQRSTLGSQNALHVGATNTFTARNTATLFSEAVPSPQQSAFRRPLPGQENSNLNQSRSASQNLLISQTPQKPIQNGLANGYPQQPSSVITSRTSILSDSYSRMSMR
jgi:hypothetical protein